jgi:hypothetical protein
MILDKYLKIRITKRNLPHFINFYKDIKLKDIINVDPNNLQKSSGQYVNVACDLCNLQRKIKYQAYIKNISSCPEYSIYTCDKCSHIKIKEFNRKKWGVDYFSQTDEYAQKFKETMLERWGVEYALQSDELKEKAKKTNIEKFGFENPFMNSEMIKNRFQQKWGVDHPSKVPDIIDKIKISTKKNWQEKKEDRIERFKQTNLEKWGTDHPNKSDLVRNYKITNESNYISYTDKKSLFKCDLDKEHEFEISSMEYSNRKRSSLPLCTVCHPIGDSSSIKETELRNFIESIYSGEIIKSYRNPVEIDVYLPELNLGFEFNGLFWHSERWKDKSYHLEKTSLFHKNGIRIIHIWEDDWILRREIIESQIRNWCGVINRKIFARKCEVREIGKVSIDFLNTNHIQGADKSSLKLGLFYGEDLVSVMTFDRFEGRKKMEDGGWNLSRFCNLINTSVIGGASKLLSYFIKKYKPERIVSYADRDWSDGGLYKRLGFDLVSESRPDYKYIVDNIRVHKSNFKKSKLKYTETEKEFTKSNGVERIWDCGKMKFEIRLK